MRLKDRLFRYERNDLMKEETGTSILFILNGPLALLTPIRPNHPLGLFLLIRFPEAAGCHGPSFFASEFALDVHPLPSYDLIVEDKSSA